MEKLCDSCLRPFSSGGDLNAHGLPICDACIDDASSRAARDPAVLAERLETRRDEWVRALQHLEVVARGYCYPDSGGHRIRVAELRQALTRVDTAWSAYLNTE